MIKCMIRLCKSFKHFRKDISLHVQININISIWLIVHIKGLRLLRIPMPELVRTSNITCTSSWFQFWVIQSKHNMLTFLLTSICFCYHHKFQNIFSIYDFLVLDSSWKPQKRNSFKIIPVSLSLRWRHIHEEVECEMLKKPLLSRLWT